MNSLVLVSEFLSHIENVQTQVQHVTRHPTTGKREIIEYFNLEIKALVSEQKLLAF